MKRLPEKDMVYQARIQSDSQETANMSWWAICITEPVYRRTHYWWKHNPFGTWMETVICWLHWIKGFNLRLTIQCFQYHTGTRRTLQTTDNYRCLARPTVFANQVRQCSQFTNWIYNGSIPFGFAPAPSAAWSVISYASGCMVSHTDNSAAQQNSSVSLFHQVEHLGFGILMDREACRCNRWSGHTFSRILETTFTVRAGGSSCITAFRLITLFETDVIQGLIMVKVSRLHNLQLLLNFLPRISSCYTSRLCRRFERKISLSLRCLTPCLQKAVTLWTFINIRRFYKPSRSGSIW